MVTHRGHLNWVFNVLPLGRSALGEFYRKISGKNFMDAGIALNAEVIRNLEWLIEVTPKAIGVHFVDATHWDDREADFVLWSDASLRLGLAFVYAGRGFTYAISPTNFNEIYDPSRCDTKVTIEEALALVFVSKW